MTEEKSDMSKCVCLWEWINDQGSTGCQTCNSRSRNGKQVAFPLATPLTPYLDPTENGMGTLPSRTEKEVYFVPLSCISHYSSHRKLIHIP